MSEWLYKISRWCRMITSTSPKDRPKTCPVCFSEYEVACADCYIKKIKGVKK